MRERRGPHRPAGVPPGWPAAVHPPTEPDWQRTAVAWLLDLCPADYRAHPVLTRYPVALVHLAAGHVDADLDAVRRSRASARTALSPVLPPQTLAEVFEALDVEEARLLAARRGVGLVAEALRGRRHVPRL